MYCLAIRIFKVLIFVRVKMKVRGKMLKYALCISKRGLVKQFVKICVFI